MAAQQGSLVLFLLSLALRVGTWQKGGSSEGDHTLGPVLSHKRKWWCFVSTPLARGMAINIITSCTNLAGIQEFYWFEWKIPRSAGRFYFSHIMNSRWTTEACLLIIISQSMIVHFRSTINSMAYCSVFRRTYPIHQRAQILDIRLC